MKKFAAFLILALSFASYASYVSLPPDGGSSGGGVWGEITGTLSAQTDLQSALDAKAPQHVFSKLTTDSVHKESDGINNVPELNVAVAANTHYMITCFISYNSSAQAIIDIHNNYPASFVYADYGSTGPNEVLATCQTRTPSNGTACVRFLNVTNNYPGSTTFYINFLNGANAGSVAFRWVSKSAGDVNTTIYAGSFCESRIIP